MSSRFYREHVDREGLTSFEVKIKETDLWVAVDPFTDKAELQAGLEEVLWKTRLQVEGYIKNNPEFARTLEPYLVEDGAPSPIFRMTKAGNCVGTGPMAAVAGMFAEIAGEFLLQRGAEEVIVENGGDIFINSGVTRRIGIYAGDSRWSGKIGLEIAPSLTPLGICTSSGTVGPSFSRGKADAVVVLSSSVPFADAAATALGNEVYGKEDFSRVLEKCRLMEDIKGVLLVCGEELAAWGEVRLCNW